MAVSLMARGGPCVRPGCGPRSSHGAAPGRAPVSFVRVARPLRCPPSAFYRSNSSWDDAAMKELMADMAKQWKAAQASGAGMSGGFFWPGGGYVYGSASPWAKGGASCRPGSGDAAQHAAGKDAARGLALDVTSSEGFYLLYADVPGLTKEQLSIRLSKERVLTLSGRRSAPVEEGDGVTFVQRERGFEAFERAWPLPDDADSEGISAKVADGVLTVTVPKKAPEPEPVDEGTDIFIS